jgi:hypothetical protein
VRRPWKIEMVGGHADGLRVNPIPGEVCYCHSFTDKAGRYHRTTYEFYCVDFERRLILAKPSTKRLRKILSMKD